MEVNNLASSWWIGVSLTATLSKQRHHISPHRMGWMSPSCFCRGLCVRSWLSGNLGKTTLRLILIGDSYSDTSLCPPSGDQKALIGLITVFSVMEKTWTTRSPRRPVRWWSCLRVWETADVHPRVQTLRVVWPHVMCTLTGNTFENGRGLGETCDRDDACCELTVFSHRGCEV